MRWGLINRLPDSESGLDLFRKEVNNLFDGLFSLNQGSLFDAEWTPSVNIREGENTISIHAETPGMNENDIEVTLENNLLTISGEKKEEKQEKDKNNRYIVSERRFGTFRRTVRLPENISQDQIKAEFKNGVLMIEIPKNKDPETKKIEIKVN